MKSPAVSAMIIAYGNPDRRDDGLGWAAAGKLKVRGLPPALALKVCRQLTPELAAEIHCLSRLAFVDAAAGGKPGALCVRRVVPGHEGQGLGHGIAPPALLALARAAYGRCPEAALFSLVGCAFDHGRGLTPEVRRELPSLIEALRRWIAGAPSLPACTYDLANFEAPANLKNRFAFSNRLAVGDPGPTALGKGSYSAPSP